jgi:type IV secretory pathway VirB4 component
MEKKKVEASSQAFLPFAEVKKGVVVMKDGSLRAVILVSSLNFALKSDDEKNAILMSYQSFLNSLDFPIQLIAYSRKIDLSAYLAQVQAAAGEQTNPLIKVQTEEYQKFITELLESSNIMEKRFYVVVPQYPYAVDINSVIPSPLKTKSKEPQVPFEENLNKLLGRVQEVIGGLTSVGLRCGMLSTEDLLELYYTTYNPDTAKSQKIKDFSNISVPLTTGQTQPGGPF